ncbi:hypothetical protein [Streptomyces sp. NPDC049906]|uniref:hypothetical protein n=1 Tax=Streptomyces sp. NPDC049906 TaxID=3155656 RepID=UPI003438EF7E
MSYTARGLLADLLSRPDGRCEDGRQMADTSTQGRGAIRKALKELTDAGFYRVEKIRLPDGTLRTETHVYDTPQRLVAPGVTRPGSGGRGTGGVGALIKNRYKEPSLPAAQFVEPQAKARGWREAERHEDTGEPPPLPPPPRPPSPPPPPPPPPPRPPLPATTPAADGRVGEAVAVLLRVIRPEPRLRLGEAEAVELAPLVTRWLERGSTPDDLARALLPGLPAPVHSPVAVLRNRLERKMPPVPAPAPPVRARYAECTECRDPVPRPGLCRACAGLGGPADAPGAGVAVARLGAARAREAMRAARAAVRLGPVAPAVG